MEPMRADGSSCTLDGIIRMVSITSKERFDDVAPDNPDGGVDYVYRGYSYVIAVGEHTFLVRIYDTE